MWVCSADSDHKHAPASVAEIEKRNPDAFAYWKSCKEQDPSLNDHLIVHKPWIDRVTFPCPTCGAEMRRVPDVIDCWFDSGCMPFAQWGFPHAVGSKERFDAAFPADFISEAIDQTRGWFYSLLMVSTLVFDEETQARLDLRSVRAFPHPFRTCIVLGHVSDKEGKKESKSKGNYTPPDIILDRVRMEFGVLEKAPGAEAQPGEVLIAREDLEGMDLNDGARIAAYRADRPEQKLALTVRAHKKLPRRVALLAEADRKQLELGEISTGLGTMPVEVPRAPVAERLTLEDESTPAPGADAFRWFFYAASPPWSNTRHSLGNVRTLQKDFQVKLRNVYAFFTIYANIDGWRPTEAAHAGRPFAERALLDRWILSELNLAVRDVRTALDGYLAYDAALRLVDLVEALSNWYVRRSRARFWAQGLEQDKRDAYATLYTALVTITKLTAPFIAFMSEEMYQNLVVRAGVPGAKESVHLDRYPEASLGEIDERLVEETRAVREIVSLGLSVRTANKLKVRQPLARADVVFNDGALLKRLGPYRELIQDELNVHQLEFMYPGHEQGAVAFRLKPNFRSLGPRLGKGVQDVKKALDARSGTELHAELSRSGKLVLEVRGQPLELVLEELEVVVEAQAGFAAETGRTGVVVLHTTLTDALIDEGYLREIMSRVQATRKELGLEFTDRIELWIDGSERVRRIAAEGREQIQRECLATTVRVEPAGEMKQHSIGEETLSLQATKIDA
ncbi:MAG TPA: DUF5915 domain-containing protein [Polyangiaceae bacterium]|nr:DUF5915 domain-containing protein [Polyangiaceae bacterium]